MLTFKEFIREHLTDEQRSSYTVGGKTDPESVMDKEVYKDTNHFFGPGNETVREELKGGNIEKSPTHQAIEQHLGKEISPEEYQSGTTSDKHGRVVKLGKQIKDEKLRNQFASDKTRAGVKTTSGHYVKIHRGVPVAGQTNTGHSWADQSCKNVDTGGNRRYLRKEVSSGTVSVVVHSNNTEHNQPGNTEGEEIYRSTLQPHRNAEGHLIYAIDSEYGVKHPSFTAHAKDVAKRLSGEQRGSLVYKKAPGVYNDNGKSIILHPDTTHEQMDTLLKSNDVDSHIAVANSENATSEHLHKLLDHSRHPSVRIAVARNSNLNNDHLNKAVQDPESSVTLSALKHPSITEKHVELASNSTAAGSSIELRKAIASHPKAPLHILAKSIQDNDSSVGRNAIANPRINRELLEKASKDKRPSIREAALKELHTRNDS